MKMHGRLGLAGGAGREAQQRDVIAPGLHGIEGHRLAQRDAVELGVVVRGAVETNHLLEVFAGLGAIDQLIHQPRVAERQRHLGLVDDLAQFAGTQHRHGVDDHGASFGRRQPACHQSRIVGGSDENAVARLYPEVLDQGLGDPIGPVGKLLVSAAASIADQRDMIAEAACHHAVGQFDGRVQLLGIVETGQQHLGPLLRRRKIVPCESIDVGRMAEQGPSHNHAPASICRAIMTF